MGHFARRPRYLMSQRLGFMLGGAALILCEAGCSNSDGGNSSGPAGNPSQVNAGKGTNPATVGGAGHGAASATATGTPGSVGVGASGSAGSAATTNPSSGVEVSGSAGSNDWPADCEQHYRFLANTNGTGKYSVPAGTQQHPQFFFTPTWSGNVQALKFKPITDNDRVLHHWIMYSGTDGAFLSGWAPGNDGGGDLPPDVGMYVPSGSGATLRLDVHYNNVGGTAAEQDASGVEVCIVSTPSKLRPNTATVQGLTASATVGAHMMVDNTATCRVTASMGPVHLLSNSPHMHKLGVYAKLVLTQAGQQMVLHDAPFSFDEQRIYPFRPDVVVNTGDSFATTCSYNNTTDQTVRFGQNTENEMCFNFVLYYPKGGFSCR